MRKYLIDAQHKSQRSSAPTHLKRHYERGYRSSRERNGISLFLYAGSGARLGHCWCACGSLPSNLRCECVPINKMCFHRGARASVIYTGDGFLNTPSRWDSFSQYLHSSRAVGALSLQVMHHGARGNWRPGLASAANPVISVFSSDPLNRRLNHPHPAVVQDFSATSTIAQADRSSGVGFIAWC